MKSTFILFLILLSQNVFANTIQNELPFLNGACKKEFEKSCSHEQSAKEVLVCLKKDDESLSSACKQEIERWVQNVRQSMRRGGGSLSGFGGMSMLGPAVRMISYEGRFHKDSTFLNQHKLNLSTPVLKTEDSSIGATLASGQLHIGEGISLDSGVKVPTELQRLEIGTQYFKQMPNRDNWGVRASVGYSSDEVLKSFNDASFSVNAHYSFNPSASGFWIATVFLGNNTGIGNYFPIPGVIYFYKTQTFTGLFGFPILSMHWTPAEQNFSYGFSIFGPTVSSEINYGSIDTMQFFGQFNFSQQSYILKNRTNEKDRLSIEEKKIGVGLRTPIMGFIGAEIQVARSFDRQLYIGQSLFKKDGGSLKVDGDAELALSLRAAF